MATHRKGAKKQGVRRHLPYFEGVFECKKRRLTPTGGGGPKSDGDGVKSTVKLLRASPFCWARRFFVEI